MGFDCLTEAVMSRGPPDIGGMVSLKVDNLSYRTSTETLRRKFERYGDVGDAYIPRDRHTGDSRGFGFVRFNDKRDASDAIKGMDGYEMDGRELRVDYARHERPAAHGGGGRGGRDRGGRDRGGRDRGGRDGGYGRRRSGSRDRRRSRSRSRSARRSRSRDRRSRSRDERKSKSRDDSGERRKSRGRNEKSASKSRSRSRSRSESR